MGASTLLLLLPCLAGGGGDPPLLRITPYQDPDPVEERQSIRKQPPEEQEGSGGGGGLPGIIHLGASYYPSLQFSGTSIPSRTAMGVDAMFGLSTFLSGVVPWHTQLGVIKLEDKGDFDLTMIKLGTGIHTALGNDVHLTVTIGTSYLYGNDVSGSRFPFFFEVRVATRDLLLPGSYFGLGFFNLNNVNAELDGVELKNINAFMLILGVGA